MNRLTAALAIAVLFAAGSLASHAMFMNNNVKVPVARVVTNIEAWIKEKPKDAQGYYVLGRIHAMAWAYGPELDLQKPLGASVVKPNDPFNGQLPGFGPYDSVKVQRREGNPPLTPDDAKHLEEAIKNYTKAIELDKTQAIYEMGLAWILQQCGAVARQLPEGFAQTASDKVTDEEKNTFEAAIKKLGAADGPSREAAAKTLKTGLPKSYAQLRSVKSDDAEVNLQVDLLLKAYWDLQSLEHYRNAYAIDLQKNLKNGGVMKADVQISAEAGEAILEILKTQPDAEKKDEAKTVADNVKKIHDRPMAVTPIIFAMPGNAQPDNIAAMIDPEKRVTFDLAGDKIQREWPWLKAGGALLVWDPAQTGDITSGRALFGSATWWIAFRDGYEALSVLDDNRDGRLTGKELEGISVWIDRNGNAVSDQGEVLTLANAGIVEISIRSNPAPDGTLISEHGIIFNNGQTVRTFDWVTTPVKPTSTGQ